MKQQLITPEAKAFADKIATLELQNSLTYLAVANWAEATGYFGAAKFFRSEAEDERKHYQDVATFLNTRGAQVKILAMTAPKGEFASLKDAFTAAKDAEVYTENEYKKFEELHGSDTVILKFITDVLDHQYRSTGEYLDFLARLEIIGDDKSGLIIFDNELGSR